MKKYTFLLGFSLLSVSAFAQSKFDLPVLQLVNQIEEAAAPASRAGKAVTVPVGVASENGKYAVIVTFSDAAGIDKVAETGAEILDVRENMAIMSLTAQEMRIVSSFAEVSRISLASEVKELLDNARRVTGVADIHEGKGLNQAYTGEGVVVGMMDTGVDPNHANFLKDGKSRVKKMWVITGSNGAISEYDAEDIPSFTTDASSGTHGTHVMGIMGGYSELTGEVIYINERTGKSVKRSNYSIPYYGVARDAELVPCCGTLQGNNIMLAAGKVYDYAKAAGKPVVFNMSLGINIGPHDGSTATNQYLSKLGKDMVICVSAGNEGTTKISLEKTFTSGDNSLKTFVAPTAYAQGGVDIWGSDNSLLTVKFAAVDKTTGAVKYSHTLQGNADEQEVTLAGKNYNAPGYIIEQAFSDIFGGGSYVIMSSKIDPSNNRYNVFITCNLGTGSASQDIAPAFIVEGNAGKTAYMYAAGSLEMMSNDVSGYSDGNDRQSINDMACGDNIIAVGAYVNKQSWPALNGSPGYRGVTVNDIAPFSSYGKTLAGKQLPDITGPGMGMISSYSHYYIANKNDEDGYAANGEPNFSVAKIKHGNRTSYWKEMSGTSMSSPFVAGVCALWLQADPTLTVDDIKNVMKETADNDEFTAVHPERWGYGKINALAGIKKILGSSGIAGVVTDGSDMIVTPGVGAVEVFAAGAAQVRVELYTVGGALAAQTVGSGDTANISTEGLAKGVYVLRAVADGTRTATRKIAL